MRLPSSHPGKGRENIGISCIKMAGGRLRLEVMSFFNLGGGMKKVLIVFLIFAYLNCYFGCTTTKTFSVGGSELPERLNQSNDYDLEIMTVDSVQYLFGAGMYRFNNDTLVGMIQENDGKVSNLIDIPLKNITRAEFNTVEVDAGKSASIILAIGAGLALVGGIVFLIMIYDAAKNK